MMELSMFCGTCNSDNTQRDLTLKINPDKRKICKECGIATKAKRDNPKEPSYAIQEPINPVMERTTTSSRVPEKITKWRFKQYTPEQAEELGIGLVNWAQQNQSKTSYHDFLTEYAKCSYSKLLRIAEQSEPLADAMNLTDEIFAERIRNEWKASEHFDTNKYGQKMFDLYSPVVKAKEAAKLKVELSMAKGEPYYDPTYPALNGKEQE